ncbi:NepR family anti-sigma factor [Sphingomonas sp.]|uniref:NepR family anti-sigma factor n=1 Tax=Sphingomonas sp. TaxID=28214 RepID=UPI002DD62EDA|nr:NepR family anti-sigma factor [Sphingomonas sp.]
MVSKKVEDKVPRPARTSKIGAQDRNVGDALRAVYQDAVSESVPDEMLDLLKKLG